MTCCYALRKDGRPCRNYAREGQTTCSRHANFFSDPQEWLEQTLWNTDPDVYTGICRHMEHALKERLIEIKPEHISEKRKHMGYVRSGVAYAILIQYNLDIDEYHNVSLYWSAVREFVSILRKYHDTFNESYTSTELSTMECKSILPRALTGRYFPLFWKYPWDMLSIILHETRFLNHRRGWGYNLNQPFGCTHVWKSLILNWLDYFEDCLEEGLLFDEEFSKTPVDPEVHEVYESESYTKCYASSMEDAWGIWRKQKRQSILDSARKKTDIYKEELMATCWHPDRFMSWCLDVEEKVDLEGHWHLTP